MDNMVLVSRSVNCSNITEQEFVNMMFSDILEAEEKYNDIYAPEYVENVIKSFETYVNCHRKAAVKFAERKWKTEKKRNAYIEKAVAEARNKFNLNSYYSSIGFFDFNVNPGSNGLSGNCCISINDLTPSKLLNCFNEVKDNYYFKNAVGWKLTYTTSDNSVRSAFRPQIKLILSDSIQNEYDTERDNLTKKICEFYKNCRYPGD